MTGVGRVPGSVTRTTLLATGLPGEVVDDLERCGIHIRVAGGDRVGEVVRHQTTSVTTQSAAQGRKGDGLDLGLRATSPPLRERSR